MQSVTLSFLRKVLLIDAVASAAMGLALVALSVPLATWLSLPQTLLRDAGVVLLPFAAFVGYVASRANPPRIAVWIIVAVNAIWTIDSFALLFTDAVQPNAFGLAFVIAQAIVVGLFAEFEYVGLRKQAVVAA